MSKVLRFPAMLLAVMLAPLARAEIAPHHNSAPEVGQVSLEQIERYKEVLARPLFSPSRRPAEIPPQDATPMGIVTLTGVVITPTRRIAVVTDGGAARSRQVREGDDLGNAVVGRILKDRIELKTPEGRTLLVRIQKGRNDAGPDGALPDWAPAGGPASSTKRPLPTTPDNIQP
jgi:hypothetical protein